MSNDQTVNVKDDIRIYPDEGDQNAEMCQPPFEPFRVAGLWNRQMPSVSLHAAERHACISTLWPRQDRRINDSFLEDMLMPEAITVKD